MKRFPVRPLAALLAVFALIHLTGAAPVAAAPTWEIALADSTEPGRPFVIEGRVYSLPDSQPLRDVTVHFWHADAQGVYGQPTSDGFTRSARFARLDGSVRTNVAGGFRVHTVLPGPAEGFAHVHYAISGTGISPTAGTLNLARSHGAGSDTAYSKVAYMLDPTASQEWAFVEPDDAGFHATCRLYVRRYVPH